jgi:hypothetical protein
MFLQTFALWTPNREDQAEFFVRRNPERHSDPENPIKSTDTVRVRQNP